MKNLKGIRVAALGAIVIALPLLSALGCSSKETPPTSDATSTTGTSNLGSKGGAPDGSPPPKSPKQ